MFTAWRIAPVVRKSISSSTASTATCVWASSVLAPRCGVQRTPGMPNSGLLVQGSSTNTSSATPPILPALEPFDQRRFVVDAAAGRVDQPHARLHACRVRRCRSGCAFRRSAACGRSGSRPAAACRATVSTGSMPSSLARSRRQERIVAEHVHLEGAAPAWRRPGRCGPGRRCRASCRRPACPCTCCGPTCLRAGSGRPGRCCATGPASARSCARPC